jgi:UPF0176 protein
MKNILFYKYVEIANPDILKKEQNKLASSLQLLGTILIAKEGINGCLSGVDKNINKYKKTLIRNKSFSDITFKEGPTSKHTFKKLHIRIRDEIVSSKFDVNISLKGRYIGPKELKSLLDKKEKIILLDARNNYEYDIGRFEGAVHLNLDTFREFPKRIEELQGINSKFKNHKNYNKKHTTVNDSSNKIKKSINKDSIINKNLSKKGNNILKNADFLKNKKIITYCTGGVRCEKASAYLRDKGFRNVYQLHGGILAYGKECGNVHWEGRCFVFDTRGAIDIDPNNNSKPITQCVLCHLPNSSLHNCSLTSCDKFFTCCEDCMAKLEGCCSKLCRGEMRKIVCSV